MSGHASSGRGCRSRTGWLLIRDFGEAENRDSDAWCDAKEKERWKAWIVSGKTYVFFDRCRKKSRDAILFEIWLAFESDEILLVLQKSGWKIWSGCRDVIGKPPPATPKLDQFRAKNRIRSKYTRTSKTKHLGFWNHIEEWLPTRCARPFGDHSMTILKSFNMSFYTLWDFRQMHDPRFSSYFK